MRKHLPPIKVSPEEEMGKFLTATLDDYNSNGEVVITFNKDREHFERDMIVLSVPEGATEVVLSRDDLASAIINGYRLTLPEEKGPDFEGTAQKIIDVVAEENAKEIENKKSPGNESPEVMQKD